ncbi:MAG: hypothetical protein HZA04_00045 [Nitrospinae bacterium]|nr:hypothetical protein [Nitrospinota bacterium]
MIAGHLTVTYALHQGLKTRVPAVRTLDVRLLLAGAFLPDILDKPLALLAGIPGRGLGHSVFVLTLIFYVLFRTMPAAKSILTALCVGAVLHLIEDAPYLHIFLWPFLGGWIHYHDFSLWEGIQRYYTGKLAPAILAAELLSYPFFLYYLLRPKPAPALADETPAG